MRAGAVEARLCRKCAILYVEANRKRELQWRNKPHRNADMIARLRRMWNSLRRRKGDRVRLAHVRSHTKVLGNELADWLAERGAGGPKGSNALEAAAWLDGWMAQHGEELARPPGGDG